MKNKSKIALEVKNTEGPLSLKKNRGGLGNE
jgi:hypothetical protein